MASEKGIIESLCIVAGGVASAMLIYDWIVSKSGKQAVKVISSAEQTVATSAPVNGFEQLFGAAKPPSYALQTVVAS